MLGLAVFWSVGAHPANKDRAAKEHNNTANRRMHHFFPILSFLLSQIVVYINDLNPAAI